MGCRKIKRFWFDQQDWAVEWLIELVAERRTVG